ncbi:MAG: deoxyguanosinetriphosphate triphosphohydrolase [bacterium]
MNDDSDIQVTRAEIERHEKQLLAPYAMHSADSQGRQHDEPEHQYRTCFQRDRDRVIHSGAFRRLKDKTQVFANDADDHFRTRLTHTMEVAQISRTIARALRLNEDLAEAVALVHDLGHTPFGHAGEDALCECLNEQGGFNHNLQSLRVVDAIEDRYPDYVGLNLTYEVREGIIKHETDYDIPQPDQFDPRTRATLEGQLVNLADEIAYNAHDADDGYFSGLINWQALCEVAIVAELYRGSLERYPDLSERKRHYYLIRALINWFVTDLVTASHERLRAAQVKTLADVRRHRENLIAFSETGRKRARELKDFLLANLYRHPRLIETNRRAREQVSDLYHFYSSRPEVLPEKYVARLKVEPVWAVVRDYVAGMTDRFAVTQHRELRDR